MNRLHEYLKDPLLRYLYQEIRSAGPIRSVSIDITHECNLRCKGCYYFAEDMDKTFTSSEAKVDNWIESEKTRGTNFVTIVGGEPALALDRLGKIYSNFRVNVATNGLIKIPEKGFENLPIGVAVWGNSEMDSSLRANGKRDLFAEALKNYRNDSRAFWYYTISPGNYLEIREVVERCIENGNRVLFNYYSDLDGLGGKLDYRTGFEDVMNEVNKMIDLYPEYILSTRHLNQVVSTGDLFGVKWGYNVCTNLSENLEMNQERFANGMPSNSHFRAYNADFESTRRCCTGIERNCDSCFDTWEHFSWIMINMRKHLDSKIEFSNWLTTTYMFYLINNMVFPESKSEILKEIHSLNAVETV